MNKNNQIVFLVEKNEKPYELTISEAIEKELNYLFGKINLAKKKGFFNS